jgi:peptidyl-prolyl cis-trans isomerase C
LLALMLSAMPATAADDPAAKAEGQVEAAAGAAPGPEAVALINGVPVTRDRFEQEVERAKQRASRQGQPVPEQMMSLIQDRVLDFLIGEELLHQESAKKGIAVSNEEVEEQIVQARERFGSEEKFRDALAQMNVTEEKLRADIGRGLAIQMLVKQEVLDKIEVSDEEIKTFYDENQKLFTKKEQIQASHILIKVDADADEAAKAEARVKIDKAAQRVKDGEDFAAVAREVSEGPSNTKGGDLGYFQRGQMVKPFEEAAFAMEPGQVSDVVETTFGYHIIKVFDKKPEGTATFDEVEPQIAEYLKKEKSQTAVQAYIEKLKESASIEKKV